MIRILIGCVFGFIIGVLFCAISYNYYKRDVVPFVKISLSEKDIIVGSKLSLYVNLYPTMKECVNVYSSTGANILIFGSTQTCSHDLSLDKLSLPKRFEFVGSVVKSDKWGIGIDFPDLCQFKRVVIDPENVDTIEVPIQVQFSIRGLSREKTSSVSNIEVVKLHVN